MGRSPNIRRGVTTGITEFFFVDKEKADFHKIETDFLEPIVTSLKEIEEPVVNPSKLKYMLFKCSKSVEELRRTHQSGAASYIRYGETQTTSGAGRVGKGGVFYSQVPTVKNRRLWYDVGSKEPYHMLVNRFIGERFFFPLNKHNVQASDTFFEIGFNNTKLTALQEMLMNSTFAFLCAELSGRTTWTQGVLYFYGPEISELPIPRLELMESLDTAELKKVFKVITKRPIKPIFEEVKMKDRQKLDSLVLEGMGLDPAKYLKPIYDGLTELVRERLELAGMQKKLKQVKPVRDIAKMTEQVRDDLVKEGIKKFPDDFLNKKPKPQDCISVVVPDIPLKLGHFFMGQQEIVAEGFSYQAPSLAVAKYIIYARKPAEYIVSLPNEETVVTKAVTDYERYLKELFQKLNQELLHRTFDHKQAETLSRRIFQELGLPSNSL